jgi:steroid delta-isomerase-like uncharacterized protein
MSIEENRRINDEGLAAWDDHSPDAFVAIFADNAVFKDISLPEPLRGKDQIRQYVQTWFTAFPDMKTTNQNVVVADDRVATEIEWTATHTGPLQGPPGMPPVPPTNKKVVGRGAYFARIEAGKVVEFSAHPDMAGMMMQLGLMGSGG